MALSILNNIPSLAAQNQLAITGGELQRTLFRLSSGSRINSGPMTRPVWRLPTGCTPTSPP